MKLLQRRIPDSPDLLRCHRIVIDQPDGCRDSQICQRVRLQDLHPGDGQRCGNLAVHYANVHQLNRRHRYSCGDCWAVCKIGVGFQRTDIGIRPTFGVIRFRCRCPVDCCRSSGCTSTCNLHGFRQVQQRRQTLLGIARIAGLYYSCGSGSENGNGCRCHRQCTIDDRYRIIPGRGGTSNRIVAHIRVGRRGCMQHHRQITGLISCDKRTLRHRKRQHRQRGTIWFCLRIGCNGDRFGRNCDTVGLFYLDILVVSLFRYSEHHGHVLGTGGLDTVRVPISKDAVQCLISGQSCAVGWEIGQLAVFLTVNHALSGHGGINLRPVHIQIGNGDRDCGSPLVDGCRYGHLGPFGSAVFYRQYAVRKPHIAVCDPRHAPNRGTGQFGAVGIVQRCLISILFFCLTGSRKNHRIGIAQTNAVPLQNQGCGSLIIAGDGHRFGASH